MSGVSIDYKPRIAVAEVGHSQSRGTKYFAQKCSKRLLEHFVGSVSHKGQIMLQLTLSLGYFVVQVDGGRIVD